MAKVSIIVPVYNSSDYLNKCLDSLINQTLKDIEIICVNDGSTDDSLEKIKKYKDKRIKVFSKENGGQASARNLGLAKATGEYILFVDSDDYIEECTCERLYNAAITSDYDIVVCDYYINKNGYDNYIKILSNKKSGKIEVKDYLFADVGPCNKLFKTSILKKIRFKFPEGIIYEDYAIIPSLVKYIDEVYYLNEAFLHYVQTDFSTMRGIKYKSNYENIFVASSILYNGLKDSYYKEELEYLIVYHLLYLGSLNFYRFQKYEQIDKISDFIKDKFPNYRKNDYVKKMNFKDKILMNLFYNKKYNIISFIQQLKGKRL